MIFILFICWTDFSNLGDNEVFLKLVKIHTTISFWQWLFHRYIWILAIPTQCCHHFGCVTWNNTGIVNSIIPTWPRKKTTMWTKIKIHVTCEQEQHTLQVIFTVPYRLNSLSVVYKGSDLGLLKLNLQISYAKFLFPLATANFS